MRFSPDFRTAYASGLSTWANDNYWLSLAALTVAYGLVSWIGLNWAIVPGAGSPVWPAAGIGLSGLMLGGGRLWPAILIGRLLAGYITGTSLPFWGNFGIAFGNALAALLPALILLGIGLRRDLNSWRSMVGYIGHGGILGCLIAALFGVGMLVAAGAVPAASAFSAFLLWFSGSFAGLLMTGPLILTLWYDRTKQSLFSWLVVLIATAIVASLYIGQYAGDQFKAWYLFPVVIMAAIVLQVRGATVVLAIISTLLVWGTSRGMAGFIDANLDANNRVIALQQLVAIIGGTTLLLAATEAERRRRGSHYVNQILDNMQTSVALLDLEGNVLDANSNMRQRMGNHAGVVGGKYWTLDLWKDMPRAQEKLKAAIAQAATGKPFRADMKTTPYNGEDSWIDISINRATTDGSEKKLVVSSVDVTDRKNSERAHRQMRDLIESTPDFVGLTDPNGSVVHLNKGARKMVGIDPLHDVSDLKISDFHVPETIEDMKKNALAKALKSGSWSGDNTLLCRDGTTMPVSQVIVRIDGREEGDDFTIGTIMRDETVTSGLLSHQHLLLKELSHRVKNMLALVQSIARQTLRQTPEPADFQKAFSGRVDALALSHSQLTESNWEGTELKAIMDVQLNWLIGQSRGMVSIDGPLVILPPEGASKLALAIHELATNAQKYGALSSDGGTLRVSWKLEEPLVKITWDETFGDERAIHDFERGFGLKLLKATYPDFELKMHSEGMCATFSVALDWGQAGTSERH